MVRYRITAIISPIYVAGETKKLREDHDADFQRMVTSGYAVGEAIEEGGVCIEEWQSIQIDDEV